MLAKSSVGRNKIIVSGYLYLVDGGNVLLQRRRDTGYHDGDYGLVSGHVEANETPRQAIVREAREEAGIVIHPVDLELAHVMSHKSHVDGTERLHFFWWCGKWSGKVENKEPEKYDKLAWRSLDNLPSNLVLELKIALECINRDQIYSEFNWQ